MNFIICYLEYFEVSEYAEKLLQINTKLVCDNCVIFFKECISSYLL